MLPLTCPADCALHCGPSCPGHCCGGRAASACPPDCASFCGPLCPTHCCKPVIPVTCPVFCTSGRCELSCPSHCCAADNAHASLSCPGSCAVDCLPSCPAGCCGTHEHYLPQTNPESCPVYCRTYNCHTSCPENCCSRATGPSYLRLAEAVYPASSSCPAYCAYSCSASCKPQCCGVGGTPPYLPAFSRSKVAKNSPREHTDLLARLNELLPIISDSKDEKKMIISGQKGKSAVSTPGSRIPEVRGLALGPDEASGLGSSGNDEETQKIWRKRGLEKQESDDGRNRMQVIFRNWQTQLASKNE